MPGNRVTPRTTAGPAYSEPMRTLGVIGGMGWPATAEYYKRLNEGVEARLGGLHSARVLINSLDFAPVTAAENAGDWAAMAAELVAAARSLESGGADGLIIAANTMHKVADEVAAAVSIPFFHIGAAAARAVEAAGQKKVGLLATETTMAGGFYARPLEERGLEVLLPEADERHDVDRLIYGELVHGVIREETRKRFRAVLDGFVDRGAESVVLAGTELGLLLDPDDCRVPMHDTTAIHVAEALDWMLADD